MAVLNKKQMKKENFKKNYEKPFNTQNQLISAFRDKITKFGHKVKYSFKITKL